MSLRRRAGSEAGRQRGWGDGAGAQTNFEIQRCQLSGCHLHPFRWPGRCDAVLWKDPLLPLLGDGTRHLCPVAVELSGHAQITRHQPCNLRLQLCFSCASHTAPTTQLPRDTVSSRLLRLSLASRTRASSATLFAEHTQISLWWPNANEPGNALTNSPRNITQMRQLDSS